MTFLAPGPRHPDTRWHEGCSALAPARQRLGLIRRNHYYWDHQYARTVQRKEPPTASQCECQAPRSNPTPGTIPGTITRAIMYTTSTTNSNHILRCAGIIKYGYSMCPENFEKKPSWGTSRNSMLVTVKLMYKLAKNCVVHKNALYLSINVTHMILRKFQLLQIEKRLDHLW